MGNQYFQFKQFVVKQDNCAMKVGTDGVLLGAWANVNKVRFVLDVGAGTGVIAMMLAQRVKAFVDAIEIEKNAFLQCCENFANCKWEDRLRACHVSLQDYALCTSRKYDLIVSNPPFFENSQKAPDISRNTARHTDFLSYEELIVHAERLLARKGKICLVLPMDAREKVLQIAQENCLFCNKEMRVKPTLTKEPKRILLQLERIEKEYLREEIFIEHSRHVYSQDYIDLTKEFYLAM